MTRPVLVDDDRFLDHEAPGGGHPESPERIRAARRALDDAGLRSGFEPLPPRPASTEELKQVHTADYVTRALEALATGSGYLDPDTFFSEGSEVAALAAIGATVDMAAALVNDDARGGLALLRPPGHHATPARAMGFCIFNNVAAAAAAALQSGKAERVLIVDWDVHHGNGTQDCFWDDDRVLYYSTHQFPFYPGTGRIGEVGVGRGAGHTFNVPLPAGCGDDIYVSVFNETLVPAARRFEPDLVLVSAGFDAYAGDPLAAMEVSPEGYAELGRIVRSVAPDAAPDRIGVVFEGGYSIRGLGACMVAAVQTLLFRNEKPETQREHPHEVVEIMVDAARRVHQDRWWS